MSSTDRSAEYWHPPISTISAPDQAGSTSSSMSPTSREEPVMSVSPGWQLTNWGRCRGWSLLSLAVVLGCASEEPTPRSETPEVAVVQQALTGEWSPAAAMATAREYHTATLLSSGKVLVAGGHYYLSSAGSYYLTSAEQYDPSTNSWSSAGSMATAREYHTATLLPSGRVLVAGGRYSSSSAGSYVYLASAELYDPSTNSWSPAGSMGAERFWHTATLLSSGKVLVAGGFYKYSDGTINLASAEGCDRCS
ncbi:MAG: kelch repeat-containing protein, partial [Pseudomonadota bacterium]